MEDSSHADASGRQKEFQIEKHIKFMERMIDILPSAYSGLDTSRMTVLFFALSGLDLMDALNLSDENKKDIINWIYAQQILPNDDDDDASRCGFRGAPYLGGDFDGRGFPSNLNQYEDGHVAMTYTALCCLLILGDDLSRVNRKSIIAGLKSVQLANGSFMPVKSGGENDMRFIYCACCISYILDDWSGINIDAVIKFIKDSMSYDHGFAQAPGLESHGGSTFCALASLILMDKLDSVFTENEIEKIKHWCIVRQKSGFQGRPNKPVDTCYSFWVGGSLELLGMSTMIDDASNREYLMDTQNPMVGGFSKWPDFQPDVLHAYFGLCGLSLMNEKRLLPVDASLSISKRARDHLERIRQSWR